MNQKHQSLPIELAASLLVPAAIFGLTRVFADFSDVLQIMVFAFLSSATMIVGRRLKLPLAAVAGINLLAGYVAITVVYFGDIATASILPNSEYISAFGQSFESLRSDFDSQISPVAGVMSFLLIGSIVAWLLAFLTDWGATRLKLAFEPVLPAVMVFILGSIPPISSGENIVRSSLVFALGVCVWAITQRAVRVSTGSVLVNSGPRAALGLVPLLVGGAVMAVFSVGVGVAYGDRLPFAQSEPVVEFSDNNAQGREVSNPFIDLEQRLVDQADIDLFQVTSNERTYWRIVGLDTYRNTTSSGSNTAVWEVRIGGDSDKETIYDQPDNIPGRTATQQIQIGNLDVTTSAGTQSDNVWIPAALSPTEVIDDGGAELNTDSLTQTITIGSDFRSAGLGYTVESALPTYTREQLINASNQLQPAPINSDIYLQVPDGVSPVVRQEADRVIAEAGATNRYEIALALQNYFQGFEYSLDLAAIPADLTAEEHFLNTQTGFCQQFSGTFALMARQLGIPTRVAVGFTWGEVLDENQNGDTTYQVTGKHAHAWPEVWFGDELGWVPFEPTPGRGLPGATQYTDLNPVQEVGQGAGESEDLEFEETEAAEADPAEPADPTEELTPEEQGEDAAPIPEQQEPEAFEKPIDFKEYTASRGVLESFAPVLGVISLSFRTIAIAALLLAYPLGLPIFVALRRKFKMKTLLSTGPAAQVQQAWDLARTEIRLRTGITQADHETASEFAHRFSTEHRAALNNGNGTENFTGEVAEQSSQATHSLANMYTACRYSPAERSSSNGLEAASSVEQLTNALAQETPWHVRWRQALTPSRVFGGNPFAGVTDATSNSGPTTTTTGARATAAAG